MRLIVAVSMSDGAEFARARGWKHHEFVVLRPGGEIHGYHFTREDIHYTERGESVRAELEPYIATRIRPS